MLAKGYIGPGVLGSEKASKIRYLLDPSIAEGSAWVTGADEDGKHVFDLVLTPQRKLAREDIKQVLENLDKQGFHLQMPPPEDDYIQHLPDELLSRNDPV